MDAITSSRTVSRISPVDALWTIIQGQSKSVRQALAKRLLEEEQNKTASQQIMLKESLNRAFEELQAGQALHDARSLFTK